MLALASKEWLPGPGKACFQPRLVQNNIKGQDAIHLNAFSAIWSGSQVNQAFHSGSYRNRGSHSYSVQVPAKVMYSAKSDGNRSRDISFWAVEMRVRAVSVLAASEDVGKEAERRMGESIAWCRLCMRDYAENCNPFPRVS